MKKKLNVSLVVASHNGKKKLPKLLNSIKSNRLQPKEIIICGTNKVDISLIKKKDLKLLNVNFIISKIKNQVFQRKKALEKITGEYILQLDDDIVLENNFFNFLNFHIKKKKKNIITMSLVVIPDLKEQAYRWNIYFRNNLYFRLLMRIFNYGKRIKYMSILPSGRICPYLPDAFIKSTRVLKNLEWTNSLICYHKSALKYFDSKYDFNNKKSYYEDVIFSHSLYKKGFKLQIDPKLRAIHPYFNQLDINTHLRTLKTQYFIVKKFKKNYFLFLLDVLLSTIFLILRKN